MRRGLCAAVAAAGWRAGRALEWHLPSALLEGGIFTEGLQLHVLLDADERSALVYADGALALELPNKAWAVLSEPPCAEETPARWSAAVVPVARAGPVEVSVYAVRCDGGGVDGGSATVDVLGGFGEAGDEEDDCGDFREKSTGSPPP